LSLVKGDLSETAPQFVLDNPETLFRIIHLSVNIYEPTKAVFESFYPRLTKGGIVAVHGLNVSAIGSQRAVEEYFVENNIPQPKIYSIEYYPNVCYFFKE
jgi:hypothetical protein